MTIRKWERKYFELFKYVYPHSQGDNNLAPNSRIIPTNMNAQRGHVQHVADFFY
jgi:hypothetical protein